MISEASMLETKLSKQAQGLCTALLIAVACWAVWGTMTETGPAGHLNVLQAVYLFKGVFYPKLTVLMLVVAGLFVAYPVALLWDFVTRRGMFAPPSEVLEETHS
jgi:hypothetical protein